jgi:hypothetical protein
MGTVYGYFLLMNRFSRVEFRNVSRVSIMTKIMNYSGHVNKYVHFPDG